MASFFRSKIGIFDTFFKRLCKESFEDLEFNSNWKCQTRAASPYKVAALKSFCKITKKSSFNSQLLAKLLRKLLATENPLKIMENAFYFILTNGICYWQSRFCSCYKPNVWYSWSLKILIIKRWFPFNFSKILRGRHVVVDGPKTSKLLADISFEKGLQSFVLSSLLLF